jgi:YhcH/YjgK/YiaL family protein
MILDKIENWKLYASLGEDLAGGLKMLASGNLDTLPEGRHELDGDKLYASVQEYQPKAPADCRWEAHCQYIDIQYLVSGSEAMGYCPVEKLNVIELYDKQKDVAFFDQGPEVGTALKVGTKMFAIFFPQDAHMPMMSLDAFGNMGFAGRVKKIVVKVKVS